MATVSFTREIVSGGKGHVYAWPLGVGDDGIPVEVVDFADRSVQVEGSFGGASISIEGSNDGVNYRTLTDPQGNDLLITTAKIEMVTEVTRYIRPRVVSGAATSVTVSLLARYTA